MKVNFNKILVSITVLIWLVMVGVTAFTILGEEVYSSEILGQEEIEEQGIPIVSAEEENQRPEVPTSSVQKTILYYDDRFTFDKEIDEIKSVYVSSRQTGTKQEDECVLKQGLDNPQKVVATGCGDAIVYFKDGTTEHIEVKPSQISLLLLVGQSNCEGRINDLKKAETYKSQWIVNEEGSVYSTYGVSDNRDNMDMYEEIAWYEDSENVGPLSTSNYERFLPSSLTDNTVNDRYNYTNALTDAESATGKGGIDSALAYRWRQLTGEKVWIINASRHGTSISQWESESEGDTLFRRAVKLYTGAELILGQEIEAGHYTLAHKGVFWCQGEADGYLETTPTQYFDMFEKIYTDFLKELRGEGIPYLEQDIEFWGIIMPRSSLFYPNEPEDLALSGAKMAQYYLTVSKDYPNIYMASVLGDLWIDDASVAEYFQNKYGDEESFNQAYNMHMDHAVMPSTLNEVHETIHYTQIGFDEIGFDAAENICYALGYCQLESETVESVTFLTDDGITARNGETIQVPDDLRQKLAIRIIPSYMTRKVQLEMTDNINYSPAGVRVKRDETGIIRVKQGNMDTSVEFTR